MPAVREINAINVATIAVASVVESAGKSKSDSSPLSKKVRVAFYVKLLRTKQATSLLFHKSYDYITSETLLHKSFAYSDCK